MVEIKNPLDPEAWEAVYQAENTPWDLGGATPEFLYLLTEQKIFPMGSRIFVPGAGKGHDPIAFAKAGMQTTALDFAPSAIAAIAKTAAAEGAVADAAHAFSFPGGGKLVLVEADLFAWCARGENSQQFDFVLEQTIFCAIHPSDRGRFAKAMAEILKPAGEMVSLVFPLEERPSGPPFGVSIDAIHAAYDPYFHVEILPTHRTIKARAGREKLGRFRKR